MTTWAQDDLGRAWTRVETVLPRGWDVSLTRRDDDRYLALATDGRTRRWWQSPDPVSALEGLEGVLLDELATEIV